jgi:hypothetical protein
LELFRHLLDHREQSDLRAGWLVFNRLSDGKLMGHVAELSVRRPLAPRVGVTVVGMSYGTKLKRCLLFLPLLVQ